LLIRKYDLHLVDLVFHSWSRFRFSRCREMAAFLFDKNGVGYI
jgi:hypothetical protein